MASSHYAAGNQSRWQCRTEAPPTGRLHVNQNDVASVGISCTKGKRNAFLHIDTSSLLNKVLFSSKKTSVDVTSLWFSGSHRHDILIQYSLPISSAVHGLLIWLILMSAKVQKIAEPVLLGEGPHWDSDQQALYFVDILGHTIHKYVPASGDHTKTKLEGRVGFLVPVDGSSDQFLVGVERKFLVVEWDGKEGSPVKVIKDLGEIDSDVPKNRLNDGKADPRGRVFGGTMGYEEPLGNIEPNKGSLYRVDGRSIKKVETGVGISNGLAWDLKEKAFYYCDSPELKVRRYDYDVETGEISNLKYIFDFKANNVEGCPDGQTIDTDGNLWIAVFDGSCVIKVDPRTGKLLQKVPIPALQVTSVTFGGPALDILFVTSASMNIKGEQKPPCGATFMVTGLGVKGLPNENFKL